MRHTCSRSPGPAEAHAACAPLRTAVPARRGRAPASRRRSPCGRSSLLQQKLSAKARGSCVFGVRESTQLLPRNGDNPYMAEDEQKKGEGAAPPPSETILDSAPKQRDPDEAVEAEDSIHSYAASALDNFREVSERALDGVIGWIENQSSAEELNNH